MSRGQTGPPLIAPGLAFVGLSVLGIVLAAGVPRPGEPMLEYVQSHGTTLRWGAFLALGAAVPLAIWSAVVYRRLRALGVAAPGSAIALVGGVVAASLTALSGLTTWVLSRTDSEPVASALRDVVFATGGPGMVPFFGLLVAGVAVPTLLLGWNRPLGIIGIAIAFVAQLSTLVLVTMSLAPTLPVGRFGGMIWLIAASLLLPVVRPRTRPVPA